jgi:hypothetical protein
VIHESGLLSSAATTFVDEKKAVFSRFGVRKNLQGNGTVCQVETSPEISNVCRAYLVMTVHKILAADTRCKGAKKLLEVGTYSSTSRHRARA